MFRDRAPEWSAPVYLVGMGTLAIGWRCERGCMHQHDVAVRPRAAYTLSQWWRLIVEKKPVRRDVFPSTQRTWIDRTLGDFGGERNEVNRHIMTVYAQPLRVYFLGTRSRWLGEPDEIVAGFFADRLARPGFLDDWRHSGIRLRRWLMNAFSYYLSELQRERRRDQRTTGVVPEVAAGGATPERIVDRAFGESIVTEALRVAQAECIAKGLQKHWGIFVRHAYDGLRYETVAAEFDVASARAAVMARTAARHFRKAVRDLLHTDGTVDGDVDDEIRALLEAVES